MKSIALKGEIWTRTALSLRFTSVAVLLILVYLLACNLPLPATLGEVRSVDVFWKLIVPLVPTILLVSPSLWRNICPLAFINIAGNNFRRLIKLRISSRSMEFALSKYGLHVAMFLLFLIVPGRLLIFNRNSEFLLLLLLLLAIASFLAGILFPYKSGWCSSICPVYPVEATYGLNPLILGENTLCRTQTAQGELNCLGCTRNCLDLKVTPGPRKTVGSNAEWHPSPALSFFIGAFPGFVSAYWLLSNCAQLNGPLEMSRCLLVYLYFLALILFSLAIHKLVRLVLRVKHMGVLGAKRLDLTYVALAFNMYYWMSIPGFVLTLGSLFDISSAWDEDTIILATKAGVTLLSAIWIRRNW